MIVTSQKPLEEILELLRDYRDIFLVGCGECATVCKSGGKDEIAAMQQALEKAGKRVTGACVPSAPCVAAQIKAELAKNIKSLRASQAILVLSCGLGAQSVKDNDRTGLAVLPGCDTVFSAVTDSRGDLYEKCLLCGQCVLGFTAGICPVALCAKGLLNGPCGGVSSGKCETDRQKDCAWVLIYRALEKNNQLDKMRKVRPPRDHRGNVPPRKLSVAGERTGSGKDVDKSRSSQ